jgi:uncharacterized membrane protein YfcA
MPRTSTIHTAERYGVPVGLVGLVLSLFGIPSRLGLSVDEATSLVFGIFTLAAGARAWYQAKRAGVAPPLLAPLEPEVVRALEKIVAKHLPPRTIAEAAAEVSTVREAFPAGDSTEPLDVR